MSPRGRYFPECEFDRRRAVYWDDVRRWYLCRTCCDLVDAVRHPRWVGGGLRGGEPSRLTSVEGSPPPRVGG